MAEATHRLVAVSLYGDVELKGEMEGAPRTSRTLHSESDISISSPPISGHPLHPRMEGDRANKTPVHPEGGARHLFAALLLKAPVYNIDRRISR